jgi:hypothetical protein
MAVSAYLFWHYIYTLNMKNVSILNSGGRRLCLWVEENYVFTEIFLYLLYIYIYKRMFVCGYVCLCACSRLTHLLLGSGL